MTSGFLKIGLLVLTLFAPSLRAQDGSIGSQPAQADRCNFSTERLSQRFIVADLNNDQRPDTIALMSLGRQSGQNIFSVRVCDSGRTVSQLTFESNERSIIVSAIDVNQDGSPDIVVEQRYTQKRIQVWLNDGHGGFHKAKIADFVNPDTRARCTVAASSIEQHHSPRRAHLRTGKRLNIQAAPLPTIRRYSPSLYHRSLVVRVQKYFDGPNPSRGPPAALHL